MTTFNVSTALPSPPTSPTSPSSPRIAGTTRIRIKPQIRPGSLSNVPRTGGERTRSMSTSSPDNSAERRPPVGKRRPQSIIYYTPSSPSPWTQQLQQNRVLSLGADGPDGESVVVNGKENVSKRSSLVLSSRSSSTRESICSSDSIGAREREPLTLVEKHADLLHFIAQKERKCLELRDQLALHEKELAELKRKWERIVNRGHEPPLTASFGALDGLKEGVRMIAAGFSDLSGVIHDLEVPSAAKPVKPPRVTRADSISSVSSTHESVSMDQVIGGAEGGATAAVEATPSLSRAGSLGSRMHKRASRVVVEPTTPTSATASVRPAPSLHPTALDTSFLPTSPPLASPVPTSAPPTTAPVSVPMSWVDSMGRKLGGLQKGPTFSKSQKRASLLLAGVSHTITSALAPGPTPTTPAPPPSLSPAPSPLPTSASASTVTPTTATPRNQPLTTPLSTTPSTQPPQSKSEHMSWLDDDEEEQTIHTGVLVPDAKPPNTQVSSFDDDDWNW